MIRYKEGYKYQLQSSYNVATDLQPAIAIHTDYISLLCSGSLIIRTGYAWDGPSGPTIDTKTFMRGSLVHDAMYQLMDNHLVNPSNKHIADKALREICIEDGMNKFRAWYVYNAVKYFGGRKFQPKPVLTAGKYKN